MTYVCASELGTREEINCISMTRDRGPSIEISETEDSQLC